MWPITGLTSLLPPEMEERAFPLVGGHDAAEDPDLSDSESPEQSASETAPELPLRRPRQPGPANNSQGGGRHDIHTQNTIRAVTPDQQKDAQHRTSNASAVPIRQPSTGSGSRSAQSSPRSTGTTRSGPFTAAGDGISTIRRQGIVFEDAVDGALRDSSSSTPATASSFRPRTYTLDGALRQQLAPATESRHRVGSVSSGGSNSRRINEDARGPSSQSRVESSVEPAVSHLKPSELRTSTSTVSKEKKPSSRSRLVKRTSSRPSSPLLSLSPSVDCLPEPIPTNDTSKILLLTKTLCGRMRGDIEWQRERTAPWSCGICYVDEEKGSLMFDPGGTAPFHLPIIPDLRGCRILPTNTGDGNAQCLEIFGAHSGIGVLLRPVAAEEFDLWLAALLCWQQLRPLSAKSSNGRPAGNPGRPSATGLKDAAVIKVGKLMLWDKGIATSPRALVKRPSARDLGSSQADWKGVSCMLQDNGEFKLMIENDVTVLSVIELSQLSRCAIQQLDKSVLDEEFCIGIFPIYSSTSTRLSILRPVYLALESRVLFEVWFVLLRAFAVPGIYELGAQNTGEASEVTDYGVKPATSHFRLEKTLKVRVTEAKLRISTMASELGSHDRTAKLGQGGLVGNYLAEVILDGEVRARTTTKVETNNPFWREECEFIDLPPTVPFLSVLLKRVDGNVEERHERRHASSSATKMGSLFEVPCGSVEIPLHLMERGKDHEQWHSIYDDRQQSIGTMLIKVHHQELIVLCSYVYQPLSELLHRFSTGLTAQISEAVHGNSRRLAEVLLNIFQASGHVTEWLMNLVEEEIDGIGNQTAAKKPRFSRRLRSNDSMESGGDRELIVRDLGRSLAGEANLLFRGNSLLTQALEFHMRRLGKEYLEDMLSDKISEINDADADCEVDPSKLGPGQDIRKNWPRLMRFISDIWECIVPSAHRVPQELRQILKYIRAVAEDRYGDFLRTVTYTSVSGFLFLRFICPAILNPKLFGLLRDHPEPKAQRTLTLIAKCLQALANLSTIGKKEAWTQPMNHFINTQRQAFKDFIDDVCAIPMERTTVTVPASYSTPITILGRLAPLSREGFPSLPYLIDHARSFAMLVKMWTDANPAGSSTRVFDGDLLEFHSLCTAIQQRANERHAQIEKLRLVRLAAAAGGGDDEIIDASQLSAAEADRLGELADVLDRSSLLDLPVSSSYGSSTARWSDLELAGGSTSTLRAPGSSGSDLDCSSSSANAVQDAGNFGAAKEPSGSRQHATGGTDWHLGSSPASTMRGLKNGKHARKLLSGFMRKGRTVSPDVAAESRTAVREAELQDDGERNRDHRDRLVKGHHHRNEQPLERARGHSRDGEPSVTVQRDRRTGPGLPADSQVDQGASPASWRRQDD